MESNLNRTKNYTSVSQTSTYHEGDNVIDSDKFVISNVLVVPGGTLNVPLKNMVLQNLISYANVPR